MFDFIARDVPGSGQWRVAGKAIDPAALACPAVDFVSLTDRIVPAASADDLSDRRDLSAGHVGMIVGSRARSDEHTSELQSLMRTSSTVFCLKNNKTIQYNSMLTKNNNTSVNTPHS